MQECIAHVYYLSVSALNMQFPLSALVKRRGRTLRTEVSCRRTLFCASFEVSEGI